MAVAALLAVVTGIRTPEPTPEVIYLTNSFHGELKVIEIDDDPKPACVSETVVLLLP